MIRTARLPDLPDAGRDISAPDAARVTGSAYPAALRRLAPGLAAVAGISAILNLLMLTGSVYMLQVYDRVLASGSVPTLVGLFAIVVVLYGFMAAYDGLRARMLSRGGLRLDRDLGAAGFRRLWRGGPESGPESGSESGREPGASADSGQALRDVETLRGFLSGPSVGALCDLPFVPLYLGVLFLIHPWLGWLTIGGAAIAAVLAWVNQRQAGRQTAEATERHLTDAAARQAETILAMGMGAALTQRWRQVRDNMLADAQGGQERAEMLAAASRSFRMLLQSAILTLGAWLVIRGAMTGGMIIAASVLSGRALAPTDQIIGQWKAIARAREAHARMRAATDLQGADPATALALPAPKGQLTVTEATRLGPARAKVGAKVGAGIGIGAEAPQILRGVSFALNPGDGLAVLGPSGAGKSTLARLLVGAILPHAGEVRLDGATLDQWDPVRLGRHIGYLPQRAEMLPGTIRDNIARFDPETPDAAVIAAAQAVGIHAMILKLPQGYGTPVGQPGAEVVLSGGQMQRLGLARALCGMPALVVLDEPNANLDQAGDAALAAAIAALRAAGSTVVVMTHRPSVLTAVNMLLYLQDGQVALFGPRDEILARAQAPLPQARQAAPAPAPVVTAASADPVLPAAAPAAAARSRSYGPQHRRPVSLVTAVPVVGAARDIRPAPAEKGRLEKGPLEKGLAETGQTDKGPADDAALVAMLRQRAAS